MIEIVSVEMTTCDSCGVDIEFAESHDAPGDKMKAACHWCYIDQLETRATAAEQQLAEAQGRIAELEQARAESTAFWIDKTETVGWQLEQAHSQIVELERKLAAALRDTTNVADKRTDGVDSQPDIADNGEGE